MAERIEKGEGLTPSEKVLKDLCEKTFLSLWSFPNLFKRKGDELCDLLIVFGDHIIIFSDKSCAFPDTGDADLDWSRWFRRSVEASAKQAFGAERWLKEQPHRVFMDAKCTRPLPVPLPPRERMKVHRVVVALGAGARCRSHFDGGTGSLMLCPYVPGEHKRTATLEPYSVGWPIIDRDFVHVLDDVTVDVLLHELSTISDFVAYLEAKDQAFGGGLRITATGEEDLLALYLMTSDGKDGHRFPIEKSTIGFAATEGLYEDLITSPTYAAKALDDHRSRRWDDLIELFASHLLGGRLTSVQEASDEAMFTNTERALRAMASEHRLARRVLAEGFADMIRTTPPDRRRRRIAWSPTDPWKAYLYSLPPFTSDYQDYEDYRTFRRNELAALSLVVRHRFPHLRHVIGIAMEPAGGGRGSSQELSHLDATHWPPELAERARQLDEAGVLSELVQSRIQVQEFPTVQKPPTLPPSKNQAKKERQRRRR